MKENLKNLITKIVDVPKLVRTIWLILWLTLFIFVIAKLCFNIWYPIVVENEIFINVCNFIDNNIILKYGIMFVFYIINLNFIFLTSTRKKKYKNVKCLLIVNLFYITSFLFKYLNNFIGFIIEILILVIITTIFNIKQNNFKNKYVNISFALVFYLLINLWQMNMLFIRGIFDVITSLPTLISLVLQLDYYILTLISWIGVSYMGLWGAGWFWGKDVTELKALKEKELAKENPDKDLLKQLDEAIAKKEQK